MKRSLALLCLLFLSAHACAAVSLSAYRGRVKRAADALETLWSFNEEMTVEEWTAKEKETLRQVREEVLNVRTVEWNNTAVQVDNSWLDQSLRDYEKIREDQSEQVGDSLMHMHERLNALNERLEEIEKGQAAAKQTSEDEAKARLASILRREEYNGKKAAEESALNRLWRRITKWLDDLFPDIKPIEPGSSVSGFARIIQFTVIALCLAGIAYLAWRYGPGLFGRASGRRGKRKAKRQARVVLGEHLEPDQTSTDLLAEAEALARRGELRAAIRKGYIALLCELADRKVLSLAQYKTNRDYLRAVAGREPLHSEMRRLTSLFEHHWYGLVPAATEDWTNFRAGYQRAVSSEE